MTPPRRTGVTMEDEMGENLDRLLAEVKRRIASYSQAELDALHKAQRESWVRGEMAMAKPKRRMVNGVMIYDSYEDYCNG